MLQLFTPEIPICDILKLHTFQNGTILNFIRMWPLFSSKNNSTLWYFQAWLIKKEFKALKLLN